MINLNFKQYSFFDAIFYKKSSPSGELLKIARKESRPRSESEDIFIITKGKYVILDESQSSTNYVVRIPGVYSEELNPYTRGIYYIKAEENSEWWCVKRKDISGKFALQKIIVDKGNTYTLEASSKYIFFVGSFEVLDTNNVINAPVPIQTSNQKEILCTEKIIGFKLNLI